MKNSKHYILSCLLVVICLTMLLFAGCGSNNESHDNSQVGSVTYQYVTYQKKNNGYYYYAYIDIKINNDTNENVTIYQTDFYATYANLGDNPNTTNYKNKDFEIYTSYSGNQITNFDVNAHENKTVTFRFYFYVESYVGIKLYDSKTNNLIKNLVIQWQ